MPSENFSNSALGLINVFENKDKDVGEEKMVVNELVSKVATFYEKFRTAMDYGSEETIPRRAIERMLKRMLFLDKNSKTLAEDLVRELVWAGYFPNATVPESIINEVAKNITLYLKLRDKIADKETLPKDEVNNFILDILSCEILHTLHPSKEKNAVADFMYKTLKDCVKIEDDSEQTRDIQIYLAIRKNFAKDDSPSLKYRLFRQVFGKLTDQNFDQSVSEFNKGYKEIKYQLAYPKKERIYNHIKKKTPPFLILYDILTREKGEVRYLAQNPDDLREKVLDACNQKYKLVGKKVQTAIIRSFIFILFTKAVFALAVEGTFESIVLGGIQWGSIALNTVIPPLLMLGVGLSIRTPGKDNSNLIWGDIQKLLFEENPHLLHTLSIRLKTDGSKTLSDYIFSLLWFASIILTFGIIWYILGLLGFNPLSKGIFIFFIAIISFLSYRIYQTANNYTITRKQSIFTPIYDFLFVPIVRLGRSLTEGITQINFLLLVIDFLIEAPFKGTIGFFEQWFLFTANKREELE